MEKVFKPWGLCFSVLDCHKIVSSFASDRKVVGTTELKIIFSFFPHKLLLNSWVISGRQACVTLLWQRFTLYREQIYGPYLLKTFMNDWYKSRTEWLFFPLSINLWLGDWFLRDSLVTHLNYHLLPIFCILA